MEKLITGIFIFCVYIVLPASWLYYLWVCFVLGKFAWLVLGALFFPIGSMIGLWSALFGAPGFLTG